MTTSQNDQPPFADIATAWADFEQCVLEPETTKEARDALKLAFYSGSWMMFLRIEKAAFSGDPLKIALLAEETSAEFEEYRQHTIQRTRK